MWDLLTGVKGEPNHWKSDVLCVLLGFGLGLEEKSLILKLFTFWIDAKEVGAQRDEEHKSENPT